MYLICDYLFVTGCMHVTPSCLNHGYLFKAVILERHIIKYSHVLLHKNGKTRQLVS